MPVLQEKYFGKMPARQQLAKLPSCVKVHLQGTRWIRERSEDSAIFVKEWVEKISGAEVLGGNPIAKNIHDPIFMISNRARTRGEHSGFCFVWVRKEHLERVIRYCDNSPCHEMDEADPDYTKAMGPTRIRVSLSEAYYPVIGWVGSDVKKPQIA